MDRVIRKGKNTVGHGAALVAKGYTVREEADRFVVEAAGIHETPILGTPEQVQAVLKEIVAAKKVLTYKTQVQIGEKTLSGVLLCCNPTFKPVSWLVTKEPKAEKAPASSFQL